MDRKLFLSYIQNLQTNNPDMIGFQNSMTKNSWLKPKSIVEMNGGGHVYQDEFDAEDRRRQSNLDAAQQRVDRILNSNSFDSTIKGAHQDLMSDMPGADTVHDWIHDSKGFHSGTGLKQSGEKILGSFDPDIDSHMRGQKSAEQYEADQDLTDMQVNALHRQGRFLPKAP